MRSERVAAAMLAATGLALAAGCSEPRSYIVLSLQTSTDTPIDNVAEIRVKVATHVPTTDGGSDGGSDAGIAAAKMRTLTYEAHGASINRTEEKTLSVDFSHGETGSVDFFVDALNNLGCSIGHGIATQEIKKGGVAMATVSLVAGVNCTEADGGAPEVPEGSRLPGCDAVSPQNPAPDAGADGGVLVCTATQTCQVDCVPPNNAPPRNECVPGGAGAPGATCTSNADCMPGTQCFNYMSTGCNVKLCLRFCNGNADCAAFGQGGGGPGSFCEGPVQCPTFLTAYHTCTFNCDPRAMAAATRGGCPTGLACVMPAAMDQVDCACPEATRTKLEGQACAQAADCAPGLICNQMSGTKTCRPICRCDANASGTCMATTNDCPTAGTTCRAVTNNTIYGICL